MYVLNGYSFDPETNEGQELLGRAHSQHIKPLCACKTPAPEMYVANVRGRYIVKSMPSTGADHALGCASFLPPDELSGLAQVQGTAIEELPDEGTTLGILVAEYKSHETTPHGAKFTFKHMPDYAFFADEDLVKRFNRIFEEKLQLASMVSGSHPIVIATFSFAKAGYPVLQEMGMMLTTKNWIPFEHMRDLEVIETATDSKRWFAKSMRFNLDKKSPIASMVLTDINPPVALFVSDPSDDGETITDICTTAKEGTYDAWLWVDAEAPMPELPTHNNGSV